MTLTQPTATPPAWLRTLGWLNIAFGLLVLPANAAVVWLGIAQFQKLEVSTSAAAPLWLVLVLYLTAGLVLVAAGVGLCQGAVWGRWLSLLGAALVFAPILLAGICVNVAFERARQEYSGPLTDVSLMGGIPALWPGYAAALLVLLNLPAVRNWTSGVTVAEGPRVSKLAIATLVLALTPAGGVTQAAALITGLIALVRIQRSAGALTGTGLALAGIVFSVLIIIGCVAWLVLSNWAVGTAFSSMFLTPIASLVAMLLMPFLVIHKRPGPGNAT